MKIRLKNETRISFEKSKKNGENMAFLNALIVNFAVLGIWYGVEYQEFGELQRRECDTIVWFVYFIVLWWLFSKKE